jgi:signal transduction histidine kinase
MQKEKLDIALSFVAASLFVLLFVIAAVMLFRIYLKRKNKLLLEKEMMNIQFEQTLLQSKLEIQEQTFADISREIHDNIGQVLSLARINLNTIQSENDAAKIDLVDELMGKALLDLRTLSHSLDTDLIRNKGWVPPVTKLLLDLQKTGKYSTTCLIADDLPRLGSDKPIILFRMIQEMINNIIKHASASHIDFTASAENGRLLIRLEDNGKGFNRTAVAAGSGLRNLESRAKMINADLEIKSEETRGTCIIVSIKTETNE